MKDNDFSYDVSVIVCTYNADWEKLKKTLMSVLLQKKKIIEIIVADDGSKNNNEILIVNLFKEFGFTDYKLVFNKENQGTCINVKNAVSVAKGKYTKLISPGDYFYDEMVICKWIEYMEKYDADVSFGNAVYYQEQSGKIVPIKEIKYPINITAYENDKYSNHIRTLNYIYLSDAPNGAVFLAKTNMYLQYLKLLNSKIKYSEDSVYRIMLLCNIDIFYYNKLVIWYEYGIGISTVKEKKWNDILDLELIETLKIGAKEIKAKDFYNAKLKLLCKKYKYKKLVAGLKYFFFPELIFWKIKKNKLKSYTPTDVETHFLDKIKRYDLSD